MLAVKKDSRETTCIDEGSQIHLNKASSQNLALRQIASKKRLSAKMHALISP